MSTVTEGAMTSMKMLLAVIAIVAVAVPTLVGSGARASAEVPPPASALDDAFDDGSARVVAYGSGAAVSTSQDEADDPAVRVAYDLSAGAAEVGYGSLRYDNDDASLYREASIRFRGDGTWNTLYLSLRDAGGETFSYRVGTLNNVEWQLATVDLGAPAGVSGGDGNRTMDVPISVHRIRVSPNTAQPPTGTIDIDDIKLVSNGWTIPRVTSPQFDPDEGPASLTFVAGDAGDYELRLKDATGATRHISGVASAAGPQAVSWDGRGDGGSAMSGVIDASFTAQEAVAGLKSIAFLESDGLASEPLPGLMQATEWLGSESATLSTEQNGAEPELRIDYQAKDRLAAARAGPGAGPLPSRPLHSLALDIKGDGTYNTLFIRVQDASGELYVYRVGTLLGAGWETRVLALAKPHSTSGGDQNKTLDWPLRLDGVEVEQNPSQSPSGSLSLRNLRVLSWAWSVPVADAEMITPGEDVRITIDGPVGGDFQLMFQDSSGLAREISGARDSAVPGDVTWDGLSDSGEPMEGIVSLRLRHDATADGVVGEPIAEYTDSQFLAVAAPTAPGESTVEDFEQGAEVWRVVRGQPVVESSADRSSGFLALRISYDFAAGQNEIGYLASSATLTSEAHRALRLDIKGDGTYNTLYLRLRDATGEVHLYRVDTLQRSAWQSSTVDLTRPPADATGGNSDGKLDYPVSVHGIVLARNGSQSITGSIVIDNLRAISDGWTAPSADVRTIVAGEGQPVRISFRSGGAGDYRITLRDAGGATATMDGISASANDHLVTWAGYDDSGAQMEGVVSGLLEHDSTPDGSLDVSPVAIGVPYLSGVSARASHATDGSIASVNSFLTTFDTVESADSQAALMEAAYVRYAREEFEWNRVELAKGRFDWVKFDRAVAVAEARNIELIGKLVYSADWASSAPLGTPAADVRYYPPARLEDYLGYVRATVERYKDSVSVWEVWNEPNLATFWRPAPDAGAYAEMLRQTYAIIKEIQPESIVLNGGLAGFSESFMQPVLAAGAPFDGLAIHTYVNGAPETGMFENWVSGAQSFLARNAPSRGLWITEAGWSTCSDCSAGSRVTELQQAEYLSRSMVRAAMVGVLAYSWFSLTEYGPSGSLLDNYGLVEPDGRTKPAYTAFARTASALAGSVSAGMIRPTVGDFSVAHDMASTSGISRTSLGEGAWSSISASAGRIGGSGALAVDYDFTASTATGVALGVSVALPGEPRAVSMWVYGDSSNSSVFLKVQDATGEAFEGKIGSATAGWSRQTLYFDGLTPNYTVAGGDGDRVLDYPLRVTSVHIYKAAGSGKTSGRVVLDDLTAHYGAPVRGAVFYGRNFVTQAVYGAVANTTPLPVSNNDAYVFDRGAVSALPVNGMKATVVIAPLPKFVVSTLLVSPNPADVGQSVDLNLISGDRSKFTLQIYTQAGVPVRTFATEQYFTSATRRVTWDGRRSGGQVAAPGAYLFRVQVYGSDGRSVAWGRHFRVEG